MSTDQRKDARTDWVGSIWIREEPGARRAGLSRDDIAAAALRIADEEGFEAVSMRRVARELGAGTMTLYHYVRNKDELVAVMADRMMAEVVVEGELPESWRDAISQIARNSRDAFIRHPWAITHMFNTGGGPSSMRHFDQSLEAVAATGLPPQERLQLVLMVDDFVFGWVMREVSSSEARELRESDEIPPELVDFFEERLGNGQYPRLTELIGEDGLEAGLKRLADGREAFARFDRGLELLLDGVEASLG